jgi:hypothetical protein
MSGSCATGTESRRARGGDAHEVVFNRNVHPLSQMVQSRSYLPSRACVEMQVKLVPIRWTKYREMKQHRML